MRIAEDQKFKVGDKQYVLSRTTLGIKNKLMEWVNNVLPNPLAVVAAELANLPTDIAKELAKEAYRDAKRGRSFDDVDVQTVLQSEEGAVKWLALQLSEKNGLNEAEAFDLWEAAVRENGFDTMTELLLKSRGIDPKLMQEIDKLPGGEELKKKLALVREYLGTTS